MEWNEIEQCIQMAEDRLAPSFKRIERIALANQERVLNAFRAEGISTRHFAPTEGYGYDDIGRDALDRVFARALQTEDALVRPQIANGTHAIFLALSGLLEPGDAVLSASGLPYDTLQGAVGLRDDFSNALHRMHIDFHTVELKEEGEEPFDIPAILNFLTIHKEIKILYVQRSRGYAWREAVPVDKMEKLFAAVKALRADVHILVDN